MWSGHQRASGYQTPAASFPQAAIQAFLEVKLDDDDHELEEAAAYG